MTRAIPSQHPATLSPQPATSPLVFMQALTKWLGGWDGIA